MSLVLEHPSTWILGTGVLYIHCCYAGGVLKTYSSYLLLKTSLGTRHNAIAPPPKNTPPLTPNTFVPSFCHFPKQLWKSFSPEGLQLCCCGCLDVLNWFQMFPIHDHSDFGEDQKSLRTRSGEQGGPEYTVMLLWAAFWLDGRWWTYSPNFGRTFNGDYTCFQPTEQIRSAGMSLWRAGDKGCDGHNTVSPWPPHPAAELPTWQEPRLQAAVPRVRP